MNKFSLHHYFRTVDTEGIEEIVQGQQRGKRRRPDDWPAGQTEAKICKTIPGAQYTQVRVEPVHRVEDGVRIIDVDNIAIEDFNARDNNETSFLNFEDLISQMDYNNSAPELSGDFKPF